MVIFQVPAPSFSPFPDIVDILGNEPANWNAVKLCLCLKYTNDSSLYGSFTYRHQSFEVYWNSCNKNLKWGFFMRTHRINYFHALESRNGFFFPKQLVSFYLMRIVKVIIFFSVPLKVIFGPPLAQKFKYCILGYYPSSLTFSFPSFFFTHFLIWLYHMHVASNCGTR